MLPLFFRTADYRAGREPRGHIDGDFSFLQQPPPLADVAGATIGSSAAAAAAAAAATAATAVVGVSVADVRPSLPGLLEAFTILYLTILY